MGKKKSKKKKTITQTTITKVVKLSYIQTLAVSQQLTSAEQLTETEGFNTGFKKVSSKTSGGSLTDILLGGAVFGLGKKKKSKTKVKLESTGAKVKDQFLQPYFDRIRYAIGIRELSVSRYKFAPISEFKSVPFISPKEIVKVTAIVDEYIPPQFDINKVWIKYYIKPEGQNDWIRINPSNAATRFEEDGSNIIPKIINFNLPKPTTSQLEDKFNFTEDPVKKIRFRAVLSRPEGGNNDSITPMLKSYRLEMVPRD